ncbi:LytR/AlgR family response regulator transcription factor [Ferruginibacter sp. SUN106]|uniref:LytR/AlgR family response regulator transcription factor n=1 Tax=Ferruginibacter sp. SUN106 TaxID=2978348 RepID=UPI003D368758
MNVVLIEDEKLVSEDLSDILLSLDDDINISQTISSVKEAVSYFKNHDSPQLIFSDIQLGDGYSFEIFKELQTTTPVIYCTAFNQHALQAFENNGIAYVLKPYSKNTIKQALDKYQSLKKTFGQQQQVNYDNLLAAITGQTIKPQTLLVNFKNKIIPIKIADVAFFTIENKATSLVTLHNQQFAISQTLDELEEICGNAFFRANRQFLINKASVKEVLHYGLRKLFVNLSVETHEEVVINKVKITPFLNWLKE